MAVIVDGHEDPAGTRSPVLQRVVDVLSHPDVVFGQWAAVGALLLLVFVGFLYPAPPAILFLGIVLGSLNALVAIGIVLIYRANRIINFAVGDLGAVAGVLSVSLIVGWDMPFFAAVGIGFIAAIVLGALVEVLVIRRFSKAPRLILTVVTIGLSSVLAYGQLAIPTFFGYDTAPQDFPVPFNFTFDWFPVVFSAAHLLVVIVVPIVVAALAAFFRYTRTGIAVRASAESADRAALLGVPVKRVLMLVWILAAALSGLAVILRTPIVGTSIGTVLGPAILLRALAPAVLARMENLPVAFGAAVVLGVMEQAVQWHTGRTLIVDAVLFVVILVGLLLQRKGQVGRAEDTGASSWQSVREVRPIPAELRRVPLVRRGSIACGAALLAVVLIVPTFLNGSQVNLFGAGVCFAIICVSLVVLTGWAGQISLGQMAFAAFGAAVAGSMAQAGWHFFLCLIAGGVVGGVVAIAIGIPALRIRGPFLAVATLAFALTTGSYLLNREFFPWLVPQGRILRPSLFGKFRLESEWTYYYFLIALLVLVLLSVRSFKNSRAGRVLVATRDNVRAAQSYGVNPVTARLSAFAFSGFIAGLGGAAFAFHQHTLPGLTLDVTASISVFSMVVIGGLGSVPGALLGAAYYTFLNYSPFTRLPASRLLGSGVGVLIILLFLRAGLGGAMYDLRDTLLRKIARARNIIVPSLLADVREDGERVRDEDHALEDATSVEHGLGDLEAAHADAELEGARAMKDDLVPEFVPRHRLDPRRITDGAPMYPLVVLFGLNAVEELDRTAFSVLIPEIRDHFGMSNEGILTLVALAVPAGILMGIPIAYYADRRARVRLAALGATVWAGFSFMTGLATNRWMLGIARGGSAVGKAVNDPTHNSLLPDYYPVTVRAKVYAAYRTAYSLGLFIGPIGAGILAYFFTWRAPFIVFVVPTLIFALLALRLKEPVRGNMDRAALGADAETAAIAERAGSFGESWRHVFAIPTLRRLYVSIPFLAAGIIGLQSLLSLFYEEEFDLNELERGLVFASEEPFQIVGYIVVTPFIQRLLMKNPGMVMKALGYGAVGVSVFLVGQALSPTLPVAIGIGYVRAFVGAVVTPGIAAVLSLVIPPKVRALGFTVFYLFVLLGLPILPIAGGIGDAWGIRMGIIAVVPLYLVGALILASSGSLVEADIKKVRAASLAQAEARKARMDGDPKILLCRGVDVAYGQTQVLFGVDFSVDDGEIVALLGTNGAGKSTLLNAISGLVEPSGGAIVYDGHDITMSDANTTCAEGIVLVPGGKGVFPTLTVAENIDLAGWIYRKDPDQLAKSVEQVLEYFPVLRERWDQKAGNLSGGEQQMLTLGQAFIAQPRLLMIDELSLGLAPVIVEQLLDIVRAIHARGTTVILVEQSVNVAITLAHRAVFMEKGEVRFDGPTAELLERPEILRAVFLQGAEAHTGDGDGDGVLARVRERVPFTSVCATCGTEHAIALETSALSVAFGGIKAVNEVDISVRQGQILGLIGPNGAGKTTIFDLVSGFLTPTGGRVLLRGEDITRLTPHERAMRGLGRSFQDARLFSAMTVRQTIAVALERHIQIKDAFTAALMSPATRESEELVAAEVERLIELMNIEAFADKFVGELSTGSRRVVDIACSMAHDPRVLLLDEPSSGIAQRETEALGPLLLGIRERTGAALIVIEHDMPLITAISDELVALEVGSVIARGHPDDVVNDPRVVEGYLGGEELVIQRSGDVDERVPAGVGRSKTGPSKRRRAPLKARRPS